MTAPPARDLELEPFAALPVGATAGRWVVRGLLGRGNGGGLHRARAADDGARVLLRELSPRGRAPEARRAIEEALARLAAVDHRCVARLVARDVAPAGADGADPAGGLVRYALADPGGLSLLELVRFGGPLDVSELVWIGHGLAAGLAALHEAGLGHGNLSPGGVHVTARGPVIVDLGWPGRFAATDRSAESRPPTLDGDVRALAATLVFAATGSPSGPRDHGALAEALPDLPADLRALLDLGEGAPTPTLPTLRAALERAADGLGLLDAGAPAALRRRLRRARAHARDRGASVGSTSSPEPEDGALAPAASPRAAPSRVPVLLVDSHPGDVSDVDLPTVSAAPTASATPAVPPPVVTPSGRLAPDQDPFASTSNRPVYGPAAGATDDGVPDAAPAPEDEAPPDLALRPGLELIHRRVVGRGGMGIVHLVVDPRLGRRAALKLLRTPATPNRVRRFQRETTVTARLDHPGIPPVHEAGVTPGGQHYLLMRYVDGESLAERLDRRAGIEATRRDPETRELLHALVKVAEAVSYAHSRGVVHRDLKPANVMLGRFGEVLVMDWGLARDLNESSDEDAWVRGELAADFVHDAAPEAPAGITQDGAVLGTPGYLAPEQARGEDVDERADVFSLGAILCEVLTGRPPVVGPTALAVLGLTQGNEVEVPLQRYLTVDPELNAIAARALDVAWERRYPSARALHDDLLGYLEGRNVSVYRYGAAERLVRGVRRHPVAATALAAVLVLWGVAGALAERAERQRQAALAEAVAERQRRAAALVAQGEEALAARQPRARELFAQAAAVDPESVRASVGRAMADRLLEQLEEERRAAEAARTEAERLAQALAQAQALVDRGDAALERGDLDDARRAYEQAMAFEGAPATARDGLVRVAERLERARAAERAQRDRQRDVSLARRWTEAGRAAIDRGDLLEAREALIKALAFALDADEAQALLRQVEAGLVEQGAKAVSDALAARRSEDARRLVAAGQAAQARGELDQARTAFVQALGFDGASEAARTGLLEVDRALTAAAEAARTAAARRERAERLRRQVEVAREAVNRGRALRAEATGAQAARDAYFAALAAFDQALALAPDDDDLRAEKEVVARELARHLYEGGHQELGDLVLRMSGAQVDPGQGLDPQRDPWLAVVEADAVRVQHAFDGAVRFQPSRAFDRLREEVRRQGDRYRVQVQVRTEISVGNPPGLAVSALWVRVEDRQANTILPPVRVALEGGPYARPVAVEAAGRVVGAWERSLGLDRDRAVAAVEAAVRRLLEPGR